MSSTFVLILHLEQATRADLEYVVDSEREIVETSLSGVEILRAVSSVLSPIHAQKIGE